MSPAAPDGPGRRAGLPGRGTHRRRRLPSRQCQAAPDCGRSDPPQARRSMAVRAWRRPSAIAASHRRARGGDV